MENSRTKPVRQVRQWRCCDYDQHWKHQGQASGKPDRTPENQQPVLMHGLSVERYRSIYSSVLQPSVLRALSSAKNTDYLCQVLELKQRLWTALGRPQLMETLREDGRVEVHQIFDLTR